MRAQKMDQVEIRDNVKVDISAISYKSFNRLYVVPMFENSKRDILELTDEIIMCVRKQDGGLTSLPSVGDVVLGKWGVSPSKKTIFSRCVVQEVSEKTQKVLLKFVDSGDVIFRKLSELKQPNKAVMKFPIMAREVQLHDVPELPDEITWTSYLQFIWAAQIKNLTLKLIEDGPIPVVRLNYEPDAKKQEQNSLSINRSILELRQKLWSWQYCFQVGNKTDAAMQEAYLTLPRYKHYEIEMRTSDTKNEILMEVVNYASPEAFVCIPKSDTEIHNFDVLDRQIRKYTSTVKSSKFYPNQGQLCFGRKQSIRGEPKFPWRRCHRIGKKLENVVFEFDTGEKNVGRGYQFRYMPPDFIHPGFALFCKLSGELNGLTAVQEQRISKILERGSTKKFKIERMEDDEKFVLSCSEVTIALGPELVIEPFLSNRSVQHVSQSVGSE